MAQTSFPSNLTVEHWSKNVFAEARTKSFFFRTGMIGSGTTSVIQELSELRKDAGDKIHVTLVPDLDGAGIVGDNELENNEEALEASRDTVQIDQLRNAVLLPGRMGRKKLNFDTRTIARDRLSAWLARRWDQIIFRHLAGDTSETFPVVALAPSTNRQIFSGDETAESGIDGTGDHMTVEEISRVKHEAMLSDPMLRPINIAGADHFILVMHPRQAYSLKNQGTDATSLRFREALRDARERSPQNPLFTGALGIWDGVVLFEHRDIPLLNNGDSSRPIGRALLLGAQAGAIAFGGEPIWHEETTDVGNKIRIGYGQIWGFKKLKFTVNGVANDFGVYVVSTDAPAPVGTSHV